MTIQVKICGITTPEALVAAVEGGARQIGLVFYPRSPRYMAPPMAAELARYQDAAVIWAQEEPYNQGAWLLLADDFRNNLAPGQSLHHATRPRSASPAVGYLSKHTEQQQALLEDALVRAGAAHTSAREAEASR